MNDSTVSMPLKVWEDVVVRLQRFAAKQSDSPVLSSVRLYERRGRLFAESTDRYRASTTVAPEDVEIPAGFNANISTRTIADISRIIKVPASLRRKLTVTLTLRQAMPKSINIAVTPLPGLGCVTMDAPLVEGAFPPLAKIFTDAAKSALSPESRPVNLNPAFLADYKAVARTYENLRITTCGAKLAYIQIGDDFMSVLVGARLNGDVTPEEWIALLEDPAAEVAK